MQRLVLASSSSYRRELLARLGVAFEARSPDVDESRRLRESPRDLAVRLARAKAVAIAETESEAFVIGSDQVICVGEQVLSKPGTTERAVEQLMLLSGRTHELITAVCVAANGRFAEEVSVHSMRMRVLTKDEASAYVAEEQPLDCAGSYRIEAGGIRLFESLRGEDYTGIVGLPLTVVRRLLDSLGFDWSTP